MNKNDLKKKIPSEWYKIILSFYKKFDQFILRGFSYNGFTSSLYYFLLSSKFHREHQSVLAGRLDYGRSLQKNMCPRYLLRRNIHRLEKGLLMRPRKDTFGADYVHETVVAYQMCSNSPGITNGEKEEVQWASEVLLSYFNIVGTHPKIEQAKKKFFEIVGDGVSTETCSRIPYKRILENSSPVEIDEFLELTRRRKSVRWYLDKQIDREDIDKALLAASMAPSACNRQPYELLVFDSPEIVKKIASLPWGTVGFRDNIPAIAAIVGKLSAFFDERDRHLIYIDASLAAMSFILALETMGISSCALNWPDLKNAEYKMKKALNLESSERVIMLISFGYPDPDGMVAYSQKKSLDELRRYYPK